MILGAALLVLAGLGLFVAGVLTGVTALYWACVAVCVVAAVLLILSRRQTGSAQANAGAQKTSAEKAATPRTATHLPAETPQVQVSAAPPDAAPAAEPVTNVDEVQPATQRPEQPAEPPPAASDPSTGVRSTAHRIAAAGATAVGATTSGGPTTGSLPAQGRGAHAAADRPRGAADMDEPGIEEVEVTDLLLVVDLSDEVLVVDEHPRYHLDGCRFLAGRETFPLPLDEARTDGFTPCALCAPDRHLADRERARKAAAKDR